MVVFLISGSGGDWVDGGGGVVVDVFEDLDNTDIESPNMGVMELNEVLAILPVVFFDSQVKHRPGMGLCIL